MLEGKIAGMEVNGGTQTRKELPSSEEQLWKWIGPVFNNDTNQKS